MRTPVAGWLALIVMLGLFALVWATGRTRALRAVAYTTNELQVRDSPSAARDDEALSLEFGVGLLDGPRRREAAGFRLVDHRTSLWQAT
jgi:hypothetical protein